MACHGSTHTVSRQEVQPPPAGEVRRTEWICTCRLISGAAVVFSAQVPGPVRHTAARLLPSRRLL